MNKQISIIILIGETLCDQVKRFQSAWFQWQDQDQQRIYCFKDEQTAINTLTQLAQSSVFHTILVYDKATGESKLLDHPELHNVSMTFRNSYPFQVDQLLCTPDIWLMDSIEQQRPADFPEIQEPLQKIYTQAIKQWLLSLPKADQVHWQKQLGNTDNLWNKPQHSAKILQFKPRTPPPPQIQQEYARTGAGNDIIKLTVPEKDYAVWKFAQEQPYKLQGELLYDHENKQFDLLITLEPPNSPPLLAIKIQYLDQILAETQLILDNTELEATLHTRASAPVPETPEELEKIEIIINKAQK